VDDSQSVERSPIGYLFTDIDSSTEKWERKPAEMSAVLARHDELIDEIVARNGGRIIDRAGDGVFAAFEKGNPLACAIELQLAFDGECWEAVGGLCVRVGVHCGFAQAPGLDKINVNRAARVMESGWGGQIVISAAAVGAYRLPEGCELSDLGLHHLKGIDEPLRLFGLVHPALARREFPPLRAPGARTSPVPAQTAPFYGRESELADVLKKLSGEVRLVTIVGAGGAGKSRFALEVASTLAEKTLVCVVPLDGVDTAAALISAWASALRFPLHGGEAGAQLFDYLRDKRALVVLDGADDFSETQLISAALASCPALAILATRREPFVVEGESVVRLGGLAAPSRPGELLLAPASALFVQAARAAQPNFELAERDFEAFNGICEAVGGSPLALRLAAQWTRLLSVQEICAELRCSVSFISELGGRAQESLRGVFEGSWGRLDGIQQAALAKLSVFAGPFDAAAAREVSGVEASTLGALEQKCLLEQRESRRFVMHPLIHDFARERLRAGSKEILVEAHERHCAYFLALLQRLFAAARGADQGRMLDLAQLNLANIKVAWDFAARSNKAAQMRETIEALFYLCVLRSLYGELAHAFDLAIENESLRRYCLSLKANCMTHQGDPDGGEAAARAALEGGASDGFIVAHCHQALGNIAHMRGQHAIARLHYERALAERTALGDLMGAYYSAMSLAWLNLLMGDVGQARDWVKESYRLCQRMGHLGGVLAVHACAGDIAVREGRHDDALTSYSQALEIEKSVRHPQRSAAIAIKLASVLSARGEFDAASAHLREAFEAAKSVGDERVAVNALLALGRNLRLKGDHQQAKLELQVALAEGQRLSLRPQLAAILLELARLKADLGEKGQARRLIALARHLGVDEVEGERQAVLSELALDDPPPAAEADFNDAMLELVNERHFGALRL